MSVDFEELKNWLNNGDTFAKANHIRITEIREGYAEAELRADEHCLNGLNFIQGGAIFTLADLAFAGASNSWGDRSIAMNASVSFIRPGTGHILKAVTQLVHKGRRSCVFDVIVTDEQGKTVAKITITGFFFQKS